MKRILAFLLAALALAPLCSCRGAETTPDDPGQADLNTQSAAETPGEPSEPAGRSYCFDCRANSITETDEAIFFNLGNLLYFTDNEYKDWMPLCPRPDCSHDSVDCDAFFKDCAGPFVYDRYLYYVENTGLSRGSNSISSVSVNHKFYRAELWRMRLDGTAHEKVCELPVPELESFEPIHNSWIINKHNKYLIVSYTGYKNEQHIIKERACYVFDLDTLEAHAFTGDALPNNDGFGLLQGEGNELYIETVYYPANKPSPELADRIYAIYRLDCSTGELCKLGDLAKYANFLMEGSYCIKDGEMTYTVWDGGDNIEFWTMSFETGENTLISSENRYSLKYFNYDWSDDMWFRSYRMFGDKAEETEPEWGVYFYDSNFELVDRALFSDLPEDEREQAARITYQFQSERYIWGVMLDEDNNLVYGKSLPEWYIDKADIGTGNLKWRKWEP